eukprot:scaffold155_cov347-Pavlova_lutheri.AAC.33
METRVELCMDGDGRRKSSEATRWTCHSSGKVQKLLYWRRQWRVYSTCEVWRSGRSSRLLLWQDIKRNHTKCSKAAAARKQQGKMTWTASTSYEVGGPGRFPVLGEVQYSSCEPWWCTSSATHCLENRAKLIHRNCCGQGYQEKEKRLQNMSGFGGRVILLVEDPAIEMVKCVFAGVDVHWERNNADKPHSTHCYVGHHVISRVVQKDVAHGRAPEFNVAKRSHNAVANQHQRHTDGTYDGHEPALFPEAKLYSARLLERVQGGIVA